MNHQTRQQEIRESLSLVKLLIDIGITEQNIKFRQKIFKLLSMIGMGDSDSEIRMDYRTLVHGHPFCAFNLLIAELKSCEMLSREIDLPELNYKGPLPLDVDVPTVKYFGPLLTGSTAEGVVGINEPTSDIDIMLNVVVSSEFENMFKDSRMHPCFVTFNDRYRFYFEAWKIAFDSVKANVSELIQHGPALQLVLDTDYGFVLDTDLVVALQFPFWPLSAKEWIIRQRHYSWPPKCLIDNAAESGYHIVNVGYKGSPDFDKEWRYSFSLTELKLIESFNITQVRCYVLMKYILKWLINPVVPEAVCSYHLKTIMFWAVEETEQRFWIDERLTECLLFCLQRLLNCLENRNCPHYFIRNGNLFANNIAGDTFEILIRELTKLIEQGWTCVLHCVPLNKGLLSDCSHSELTCACFRNKCKNKIVEERQIIFKLFVKLFYGFEYLRQTIEDLQTMNVEDQILFLFKEMSLDSRFRKQLNIDEGTWNHVTGPYRSLFLSIAFAKTPDAKIDKKRLYILQKYILSQMSRFTDVSSTRLKLANLYYVTGKLRQCIDLCKITEEKLKGNVMKVSFMMQEDIDIDEDLITSLYDNEATLEEFQLNHLSLDVVFTPLEITIVPDAVRDEMCRPKTINEKNVTGWGFIDPNVYAYFLVVVSTNELGDHIERDLYVRKLEEAVSSGSLLHQETANNLLVICRSLVDS